MSDVKDRSDEADNPRSVRETIINFVGGEGNKLVATAYDSGEPAIGPPALFMHGGGQTRHSWNGAAEKLARLNVPSISVDARGHGDSAWVESRNYSFLHYRDDMIALVREIAKIHGKPPILIGASMGGLAGMLTVEKEGSALFSALVFVDVTPSMTETGVSKILGFMSEKMRDGFAHVEEAADAIARYLPNRPRPKTLDGLRKNLRRRDDGRLYWHWDPSFLEGPAPINSGKEGDDQLLISGCRKISVPTLLVRGSQSELVTREAVNEFLELVPHAKTVDVGNAGHMVAGDKNDIFASSVIKFLREDVLSIQ